MDNLIRFVTLLIVAYSALLLWVYFNQQNMLYFPSQFRPSAVQAQAQGMQLWPESGAKYRGLLLDNHQATATAIVFHGNAGTAWDRRFYANALSRLNYRVILAEYPGYGSRSGTANETNITADALETIALAKQQFSGPISLWGESLGAAVAVNCIAGTVNRDIDNNISAAVLITPWNSLPELAQKLYWYLPVRWLTREQYDNKKGLSTFQGRTALLVAAEDEIIPNRHSMRLYDSIKGGKQLWMFDQADHNSWPTSPQESWWSEVDNFIRQSK